MSKTACGEIFLGWVVRVGGPSTEFMSCFALVYVVISSKQSSWVLLISFATRLVVGNKVAGLLVTR